ncbi:MAG: hypothetical protein QM682_04965 [Paracoccus sp. (in: a-proteobacteria)]|uniref:hypothetical protein n=1 Tax=Paracoccus sp. TaxID=267 RepID=UPI0039E6E186
MEIAANIRLAHDALRFPWAMGISLSLALAKSSPRWAEYRRMPRKRFIDHSRPDEGENTAMGRQPGLIILYSHARMESFCSSKL